MPEEKLHALVIDDEPTLCHMLVTIFERAGWEVAAVQSAEAAQLRIEAEHFDVLLVDKNLPQMDGVDLVRWVRQRNRSIAILMITAYASSESALVMIEEGIDGYITKPFSDLELLVAFAERVATRGRERARVHHAPMEAHPIHVAAATLDDELAEWLFRLIDPNRDDLRRFERLKDARLAVEEGGVDLLVLDAALSDHPVVELLEAMDRSRLGAVFVAARQPPELEELMQFIGLGVRSVLVRPLDEAAADKVHRVIAELREK